MKVTIKNILLFFEGNIRYQIYYSKFKWLIKKHIREQIKVRINSMDKVCFDRGSCKLCGCKTVALQMADKACNKPCYPKMLEKELWEHLKSDKSLIITNRDSYYEKIKHFKEDIKNKNFINWKVENNKFVKL